MLSDKLIGVNAQIATRGRDRAALAMPERLRILLADDDCNDLALTQRAFRTIQQRVQLMTVSSGEEAIAYLLGDGDYGDRQKCPFPDVVVLDHRMPRLCGLSVLSWLRTEARFVSIPVLILSLALAPSEADAVSRLRAAWRRKPVECEGMLKALKEGVSEAFRCVDSSLSSFSW